MSGPHPLLHPLSSAVLSAIRAAFSFAGSRVRKVRAVQVFPSSPLPPFNKTNSSILSKNFLQRSVHGAISSSTPHKIAELFSSEEQPF